MRKLEILALLVIILGGFLVRLYKFDAPIGDWHSWRQADTSAVSRNYAVDGIDLLHPKFDDLSQGVSLIDNPQGYRFVEFPLYNAAQAGLFNLVGVFTIEQWGRLVTIFSSLLSTVFLFLLVSKYLNVRAALWASFFFAFLPYNIYYGRVILPDSSMVAAILGGLYFFSLWIDRPKFTIYNLQFTLALLFTTAAILLKPYALFFTFPMIYLAWQKYGKNFVKKWQLWTFLILSIAPYVFWQVWSSQYPAGIPRNDWLLNGNGIRFKGAFFHWLFGDRIGQLILGYFGLPYVVLGILKKVGQKEKWFFFSFLLGSLAYITVFATGNIQHDYYQILIIPTLAVFFGKGVDMVLQNAGGIFNKYISYLVVFVSVTFMIFFGWFLVRDYYNIQRPEIIEMGLAVQKLTPKDAKIIAPYGGDTTVLYAMNRKGWPVFDRPLKDFIKQGATYMVFVNPGLPELDFKNQFVTTEEGNKYIIYDLTKPLVPVK